MHVNDGVAFAGVADAICHYNQKPTWEPLTCRGPYMAEFASWLNASNFFVTLQFPSFCPAELKKAGIDYS
jgi:hypothetical protein